MPKFLPALIAGLLWIAAGSLALAATNPVNPGKAVGVDPSAVANFNDDSRTLVVGSDVGIGETVVTGAKGDVQLLFADNTKLLVGPNSSLLIEAYLLRSDNTLSQFAVNALTGSFRFITGDGPKPAYRIDTPTGMIGVRGTEFDFNVDPKLGTTLVLFHGAVQMCNLASKCIDVTQTCAVGRMAESGSSIIGTAQQTAESLRAKFPYVRSQAALLPAFQSAGSGNCLTPQRTPARRAAVVQSAPPSFTPPPIIPPTITLRPPRGTYRPPRHVYDPCLDYRHLSRTERLALRREGIVCPGAYPPPRSLYPNDGPPGSLIGNPFRYPPRMPPRRGANDDDPILY